MKNIINDTPKSANMRRDEIAKNRKKREENSEKYSVSFNLLDYKFNREEANNYDE